MLYDIKVQVFMAPTMYSPGFKEEQKTKPEITKKIEEPDADDGLTPEQAAKVMLKGDCDVDYHFS
jgi:3-dehydrosphinganine reductase